MKRRIFTRFLGFLPAFVATLLLCAEVRGEVAAKSACEEIKTTRQLIDCISQRHPDIQRSEADMAIAQNSQRIARERPNPELDSRQVFGLGSSEESLISEVNLAHSFELGGKRKARIQKSRAYQSLMVSQHIQLKEKVVLAAILNLYRMKQLQSEKETLSEAIQTFKSIQSIYQKRPILDPEQKASLSVFQLAERELGLKKASLIQEEWELKAALEKSMGQTLQFSPQLLPKSIQSWPVFTSPSHSSEQASLLKVKQAELDNAQASGQIAKSDAWPNLKAGPSLEIQNQREGNSTSLGFNFSLPLPLYHQNQGKKEQAMLEQKKAELNLALAQKDLELEKQKLLQEYDLSTKFLKEYKNAFQWAGKHQEIESFFERGLVPSALVLEMHRQFLESVQAQHVQEMKALEALWGIYALEGRILEQKDQL